MLTFSPLRVAKGHLCTSGPGWWQPVRSSNSSQNCTALSSSMRFSSSSTLRVGATQCESCGICGMPLAAPWPGFAENQNRGRICQTGSGMCRSWPPCRKRKWESRQSPFSAARMSALNAPEQVARQLTPTRGRWRWGAPQRAAQRRCRVASQGPRAIQCLAAPWPCPCPQHRLQAWQAMPGAEVATGQSQLDCFPRPWRPFEGQLHGHGGVLGQRVPSGASSMMW